MVQAHTIIPSLEPLGDCLNLSKFLYDVRRPIMVGVPEDVVLLLRALCLAGLIATPALVILSRARLRGRTPPAFPTRYRTRAARACMAAAALTMAWAMRILGDRWGNIQDGMPFVWLGGALFLVAMALRRPALPVWPGEAGSAATAKDPAWLLAVRAALAAAGAAVVVALSDLMQRALPSYPVQVGAWALGVTAFVVAAMPGGAWAAAWRGLRDSWKEARGEWLFVLACTGAALALRLIQLESALPILFGDEAPFGRDTVALLLGARVSLFAPGHQGHPWLFPAMQAPLVSALGHTLTAVRLLPACVGALTAPATYLLGREMFDRRVAAGAAAFLATYPVHVHFSRLGLNNIFDSLFAALTFALLLRGLRTGGRLSFALAGVSLGLGQYFYSSGRLLLVLIAPYLVYLALARGRLMRAHWRGLATMLGAAALTVWPAFHHLYVYGVSLVFRAPLTSILMAPPGHETAIETAQESGQLGDLIAHQLSYSVLGYIHIPDQFHFYGGQTAMLLPAAAGAFLLGVMWAFWRWAHPPELLLLAWIALTALLGGALLVSPPGYARYVIVTPALAVMVAMGLVRTVDYLLPALSPASLFRLIPPAALTRAAGLARLLVRVALPVLSGRRRLVASLAASLTALLVVVNVGYYFGQHLDDLLNEIADRGWELRDLHTRIAALPPEMHVYIISSDIDLHAEAVMKYFLGDRVIEYVRDDPVDWVQWDSWVSRLERGSTLVIFVQPTRLDDLQALMRQLPGGMLLTPTEKLRRGVPYPIYIVQVDAGS